MDVLVDYYNIPEQERRKGVPYVVDRIMATMVPNHVDDRHRRVDIRLYGGWYEERSLTRDAQQIERALSGPIRLPVDSRRSLIVHVELAYSMRCDPSHHLWRTLRSKAAPRGLEFRDPTDAGCRHPDSCPLRPGYDFFVSGNCPERGCRITRRLVVRRREQKLVDAMLAADVFFNVHSDAHQVAVVSSDDDMWPVINTALQFGVGVIHVQTTTRGSRQDEHAKGSDYLRSGSAVYVDLSLFTESSDGIG